MTRITSAAANTILINRFLRTQSTLQDLELQVATEKKSQLYSGISTDSQRLLNIENTRDSLKRFVSNNEQADLRVNIQTTALDAIETAMRDFRGFLVDFSSGNTTDAARISDLQDNGVRALLSIQSLLNTEADGRFIFAGGNVRTEPVDFGISTLSSFQSKFDGARVTVPTTRTANLESFAINRDNTNLDAAFLSFQQVGANGDSRITSTSAQFQNIAVGTAITLSGTDGGVNDGTFTVKAVDTAGNWIDVKTEHLTDEGTPATAPIFTTFTYPNSADPRLDDTFNADVTFDRHTNTITAETANALSAIPVGSVVTISGTTNNNASFTVDSNDGTSLVVKSKRLVTDGAANTTLHTVAGGNNLSFTANTITAGVAGTYSNVEIGQRIKINNTNTENDGKIFTIANIDTTGTTITIASGQTFDINTTPVVVGTVAQQTGYFGFNPAERNFYFDASVVGGDQVQFTDNGANPDTVVLTGRTFTDAKGNLLPAGTRLAFTGTGSNNATYTIGSISTDGTTATLVATDAVTTETAANAVAAGTGSITFTNNTAPTKDSITLGGGFFRDANGATLPAGTRFALAGTGTANDGTTFTIDSVSADGRTATLIQTNSIDATTPTVTVGTLTNVNTVGTVAATSYFKGDQISLTHRAGNSRSFEFDTTAVDPAFEKAVRAIELIIQGVTGSEGGLDRNQERVGQALFLLDSALDITNTSPPPFGTEENGSVEELSISLGFRSILIDNINNVNKSIIGFFDGSVADIENVDSLDAITRLLDSQRVLEASFQTFSRTRQLSLTSFL